MNLDKEYINYLNLVIIITLVASFLIISSSDLSFAIQNDENEKDDKDLDISVSSIDKTKKIPNGELKETDVQYDILKGPYPDQFFICGYPQQLIEDYNSLKFNCN